MERITIETYKFEELDEKAQKKAIEWYREHAWDSHNDNQLTDDFCEYLEENGLVVDYTGGKNTHPKVWWSLGNCQGDGVAFEGKIDLDKLAAKHEDVAALMKKVKEIDEEATSDFWFRISHSGHYYHENSMSVDSECSDNEALHEIQAELQTIIEGLIKEWSRHCEKMGYDEIDYVNSDESIIEMIEANEYNFTKEGKRSITL